MAEAPQTQTARQYVRNRFVETIEHKDGFLVGAAVGAGITAQAAEDGGADFILAISAGRIRIMGGPSMVANLPVFDSNRFVFEFARTEILSQCSVPVYFGACAMDPELDIPRLITEVAESGFDGVVNWPTATLYPESFEALMEQAGIGFSREVELLLEAQNQGLATLAYVRNREQAIRVAAAGIDAMCVNIGWNTGGVKMSSNLTLEELGALIRSISRGVTRTNPDVICMLGYPIETAEQVGQICPGTRVRGYIGGSTLDRFPVQDSIAARTMTFKQSATNMVSAQRDLKQLESWGQALGLIGASERTLKVYDRLRRLADKPNPVFMFGEEGTPKTEMARAMHLANDRTVETFTLLSAARMTEQQIRVALFGSARHPHDQSLLQDPQSEFIVIEEIDRLTYRTQSWLSRFLQTGRFSAVGSRKRLKSQTRLCFTSHRSLAELKRSGGIYDELALLLEGFEIAIPPLRERVDDLRPIITETINKLGFGTRLEFSPTALRKLTTFDWPGNDAEARMLARQLVDRCKSGVVSLEDVSELFSHSLRRASERMSSERDLILDALWRHRFNRQRTAQYLGVSRKTLYNKIQRYGITK